MPSEEMLFQRALIDAMHSALVAVCARLRLRRQTRKRSRRPDDRGSRQGRRM
jgi:hypothetical protein